MNLTGKKQMIGFFLSEGFQLDESSLNYLLNYTSRAGEIVAFMKEAHPGATTITSDSLKDFLEPNNFNIDFIKSSHPINKPYTTSMISNYLGSRYDFLQGVLQKRMELVNLTSISKIGQTQQFSLIILIREIDYTTGEIVVEDKTGSTKLHFTNESGIYHLAKDEVIGVVCHQHNNKIMIKNIVHPDININREIKREKDGIVCVFLSVSNLEKEIAEHDFHQNLHKQLASFDENKLCIFVMDDNSNTSQGIEELKQHLPGKSRKFLLTRSQQHHDGFINLEDPATIKIGTTTIFLSSGTFLKEYDEIFKMMTDSTLINLIKKRHLNPTFKINNEIYEKDPYLLDIIPDIIAVGSAKAPNTINYKGIMVLVNGSFTTTPVFWGVNLQTREAIKIDFT